MREPSIRNPQTFVRVRRQEVRRLANAIGNAAMDTMAKWPASGEGRQIKDITEQVSRLLDGSPNVGAVSKSFAELRFSVDAIQGLMTNSHFVSFVSNRIVDPYDPKRTTFQTRVTDLIASIRDDMETFEAIRHLGGKSSEALRNVTPAQKDGPIEFVFDRGILRIQHRISSAGDHHRVNAENARLALLTSSQTLLKHLAERNHDKRITTLINEAMALVHDRRDVIALGLNSIALSLLAADEDGEMAGPVLAQLRALNAGIGMYLAQFPEWVRFTESAAAVEFTPDDVDIVRHAGEVLLADLTKASAIVDPEVPRTVRWILGTLSAPKMALKRAVFASIRMIENFVSVVYTTFSGWLDAVNTGVKKTMTAAGAAASGVLLLLAATKVAEMVSPTATQTIQTAWLKDAADIVRQAMPDIVK